MPDYVIDTNVLIVASAADPGSPFDDTHVPPDELETILDWLVAFKKSDRFLVLDSKFQILNEYKNKLNGRDLGLMVIMAKMGHMKLVDVEYESDGTTAKVPEDFAKLDPSDRKFLAAALADSPPNIIVNATDSDWFTIENACERHGVTVKQLIGDWLRESSS